MQRFFYLVVFILFFSCTYKASNDFDNSFVLTDSLYFNNALINKCNFYNLKYNNQLNSFTINNNNELILINTDSSIVNHQISLPKADSLYIIDYLIYKADSIFISFIERRNNTMYIALLNQTGEILKQWNISKYYENMTNAYFYINANYLHPMFFVNNKLFVQASYRFKPGIPVNKTVKAELVLDISDNQILKIAELPDIYKKNDFYGNHQYDYSRIINKQNELVFSFPISSFLYVYDFNGKLLKTINCKSKFIDKIEAIEKSKLFDLSAIIDSKIYNPQYANLIFDQYNMLYYRIVLHKLEKHDENGKINNWNKRKWSVMILDENLKILNEVLMPDDIYWKHFLITKKGLLFKTIESEKYNFHLLKYKRI